MRSRAWLMVVAIILITLVSACTCAPLREPVLLPAPVSPILPAIKAVDLACLSDITYAQLVERDRLRKNVFEECAAIIDGNNAGVSHAR